MTRQSGLKKGILLVAPFLAGMILDLALSGAAPDRFPPHRQCSGIGSEITRRIRGDTWATTIRYQLCALMPVAAQATSVPRPSEEEILNQAEEEVEQGRFDEALRKCRLILSANPRSAYAYFLAGVIEFERGDDGAAQKDLTQSVTLDPSRIATRVALGKVYINLKQWARAQTEFQRAIDLGDNSGSVDFGVGLALLKESRPDEALPLLLAAVKAGPREWWRLKKTLSSARICSRLASSAHAGSTPIPTSSSNTLSRRKTFGTVLVQPRDFARHRDTKPSLFRDLVYP